jgi:hypothetical protein
MNELRPRFHAHALVFLTTLALGGFGVPVAWAQEAGETSDGDTHWGLGVGLGFEQKPSHPVLPRSGWTRNTSTTTAFVTPKHGSTARVTRAGRP